MVRVVGVVIIIAAVASVGVWAWQSGTADDAAANEANVVLVSLRDDPSGAVEIVGGNTHKFGVMDQNETDAHVFELKNVGNGPLRMALVSQTCRCTYVKLDGEKLATDTAIKVIEIPEGESKDLELAWEPQISDRGPFRQSVGFQTSDPDNASISLFVEGNVLPGVEYSQQTVEVEEGVNDDTTLAGFRVASMARESFEIEQVSTSNPLVNIRFEPMDARTKRDLGWKSGFEAIVEIQPGMPIGPFSEMVKLSTNVENHEEKEIRIHGKMAGPVMMTPLDYVRFNQVRVSKGGKSSLFLKIRHTEPVEVEIVKQDPAFLEIPPLTALGNNRFRLDVIVPPNSPGGNMRGSVELKTTHPTATRIIIPILAQIIR